MKSKQTIKREAQYRDGEALEPERNDLLNVAPFKRSGKWTLFLRLEGDRLTDADRAIRWILDTKTGDARQD